MMNLNRLNPGMASVVRRLSVLLLVLAIVPLGASAASVLDHRGDTSFYSPEVRPFENFPPLESIVPMPLNINPFNRQRVRETCVIQAIRQNRPARGVKGVLSAKLLVLDRRSATYSSVDLASSKFKTDDAGQASMTFDVRTDLFAEGFRAGEIGAWSYTVVEFTKRKGTFALLGCDISARK